jgi:hypothetical protein
VFFQAFVLPALVVTLFRRTGERVSLENLAIFAVFRKALRNSGY